MRICFPDYQLGPKILSLAKSKNILDWLLSRNLEVLYCDGNEVSVFPENRLISNDSIIAQKLCQYNEEDVFTLNESGDLYLVYNTASEDNAFLITNRCNSNCLMCPSPEYVRRNGETASLQYLMKLVTYFPETAAHLTITGGEPFLIGKDIFHFFSSLKEKYHRTNTEFLLLTNGRVFAVPEYCLASNDTLPLRTMIGIPIHGSNAETHDRITQAEGSFEQTKQGIKNMIALGRMIELRIVVSRLNAEQIGAIADLFIREFNGAYSVKIMGLEMLGSAFINRTSVWIPYREAFLKSVEAINKLIYNGFDVQLYNFPLCAVDRDYWSICAKSISAEKVRFSEKCSNCAVKDACGGLFAGSFRMAEGNVEPIQEEWYDRAF
ncbi:MAG: His-Xaa-Ser system radical SAM maturase HxsC [Ruminococcaceae bacterium]|nr:His-Xaa-Ser system radical SAM maturase HxsC [Oscillospiraceae bacterium]